MLKNLHLNFFNLDHFSNSDFYLQLGFVLSSVLMSSIFYQLIKGKINLLPTKYLILTKVLTQKTCYLLSLLLSMGLLLPAYLMYVSESVTVVFFVAIVIGTSLVMGMINSLCKPLVSFCLNFLVGALSILILTGLFVPLLEFLNRTSLEIGVIRTTFLKLIKSIGLVAILAWGTKLISKRIDTKLNKNNNINKSTKLLLSKLTRALLVIFSVFLGMSVAGIDLSIITFFAGALGVGVGFGLQNIISNLFSGVILLLDRSIKLGDVIALKDGDTYGIVHKFSARFVSVRTREGIEHLIPNEQFINSKTENWTHSDPLIRISVLFEVALDTDINLLEEILLKIAVETDRVLKDPKPNIRVISVNTNCIQVKLRVWLSDPENGKSSIQSNIYRKSLAAFKEFGIEMPFPPLELYLNHGPDQLKELSQRILGVKNSVASRS